MTHLSADQFLPPAGSPLRAYVGLSAGGGVLLALASATLLGGAPAMAALLGGILYVSATVLAAQGIRRSYPHSGLGLCNAVTQARLVLVALLAVAMLTILATGSGAGSTTALRGTGSSTQAGIAPDTTALAWIAFALAIIAFALDGVDGWLARREGLVSGFGARFDMEVDSVLALILALFAFANGTVGPLVLVLGLARYAFWAASIALPWLSRPLPDRFSRKLACVVQIATLVALLAPVLPPLVAELATLGAVAILAWSFGLDIRWQWRADRRAGQTS